MCRVGLVFLNSFTLVTAIYLQQRKWWQMNNGKQVSRICCRSIYSTKYSMEVIQKMHELFCLGMGDWTASSSDSDHEKENVEPAEKKCKSLKLNRKELD